MQKFFFWWWYVKLSKQTKKLYHCALTFIMHCIGPSVGPVTSDYTLCTQRHSVIHHDQDPGAQGYQLISMDTQQCNLIQSVLYQYLQYFYGECSPMSRYVATYGDCLSQPISLLLPSILPVSHTTIQLAVPSSPHLIARPKGKRASSDQSPIDSGVVISCFGFRAWFQA